MIGVNNNTILIPNTVPRDLPHKAQSLWISAYNQAIAEGNGEETGVKLAWGSVQKRWQKNKAGEWVEKKTAGEKTDKNQNLFLSENLTSPIPYKTDNSPTYKNGDIVDMQFCCIGDNVEEQTLNDFIKNFYSQALGQSLGLHVDHPFFGDGDYPTDKQRYGDIMNVYRKGSVEGWISVRLNNLGADALNNRAYLYLSPGWWGKYKHKLTGEEVKNVLFEVSMTNMPAEKMMASIVQMAEKILEQVQDDRDKQDDPEEDPLESLIDQLGGLSCKITDRFKNKAGNAGLRAKVKDVLSHAQSMLEEPKPDKSEKEGLKTFATTNTTANTTPDKGVFYYEKEEKKLTDDGKKTQDEGKQSETKILSEKIKKMEEELTATKKTLEERDKEVSQSQKQLSEKSQEAKNLEERVSLLEEQRFEREINTLAESYLPQPGKDNFKLKKAEMGKFLAVARRFKNDSAGLNDLKTLMESLPGMTIDTSVRGVSGIEPGSAEAPQKMTEAEISNLAMEKAKADPNWKKQELQEGIYKNKLAEVRREKGVK